MSANANGSASHWARPRLGAWLRLVGLLASVAALLACPAALAADSDASGRFPLALEAGVDSYPLGLRLEILEDRGGRLDIGQVSSAPWAGRFRPLGRTSINRGASPSAYWLRWSLTEGADGRNRQSAPRWFLDVGQPSLAYVSLYTPRSRAEGGGWRRLPVFSRNLRHFPPPSRFAVFRLPLEPGRARTFYLRLQSTSLTALAPRIYSFRGFVEHNRDMLLLQGAFCGAIISLAIYNLVVFFSLRDRSYLWYVLAIFSMALYYLGWNGMVQDYLPNIPAVLNRHLPIAFLSSLFFCRGLFARHFLLTREQAPRLDRLILASSLVTAVVTLAVPLSEGMLRLGVIRVIAVMSLGWPVLLMGAAAWRRRQGFRPASFFLLAYSVTAAGEIIYLLLMLGVAPFREVYFAAHQLGGALEAILLSLALGYRIRNLQQQTREAEHAARESRMHHRLVMESAPYPMAVCDAAGRVTYLNPAFHRVFGWEFSGAEGMPLGRVLAGREAIEGDDWSRLDGEGELRGLEIRCRTRGGEPLEVSMSAAVFRDSEGHESGRVFILEDISERKRSEAELAEYQKRLRRLALELTTAEERQRRRIAEDLHDGVSQNLAAGSFRLKRLEAGLESPARREVEGVSRLLDQSLADIRSLTFEISPPVLYDYGLGEALEWLAEHINQRHGLAVELHREGEAPRLDLDRQVSLYRACQELLVNVVKHARAQRAWVTLSSQSGQTVLDVRDDGRGFDAAVLEGRSGGFGLFSIRERLEPLGGGMRVDSRPGRGARITLRLPPGRETNAE